MPNLVVFAPRNRAARVRRSHGHLSRRSFGWRRLRIAWIISRYGDHGAARISGDAVSDHVSERSGRTPCPALLQRTDDSSTLVNIWWRKLGVTENRTCADKTPSGSSVKSWLRFRSRKSRFAPPCQMKGTALLGRPRNAAARAPADRLLSSVLCRRAGHGVRPERSET